MQFERALDIFTDFADVHIPARFDSLHLDLSSQRHHCKSSQPARQALLSQL